MAQLRFTQINRMTPSTQILQKHLTTNSQVSLRDRTKVCHICIPALHGSSHCFHNTGTASCCKRQNSWIIQTFYKHPPLHILASIYGPTNQTDFVMLRACGFNGCCSSRARWTQVPNLGHTKKKRVSATAAVNWRARIHSSKPNLWARFVFESADRKLQAVGRGRERERKPRV